MTLFERTLKMVSATFIAIVLAMLLKLSNSYAAGIIAILSLLDTRTDTIKIAQSRLIATVLSFLLAWMIFSIMGYSIVSFTVFLVLFIPLSYRLGIQAGIAPCSVLVTHFIAANSVSHTVMLNGLLLMFIGTTSALLLNTWMASQTNQLMQLKKEIDEDIKTILCLMAETLSKGSHDVIVIQQHIRHVKHAIMVAHQMALREYDNAIFQKNDYLLEYLYMRENQVSNLVNMVEIMRNIPLAVQQSQQLAALLYETMNQFDEHNTGLELLEGIATLFRYVRQSTLPQSRIEFEARALLYTFLIEFNRMIEIKHDFYLVRTQEKNK
ncbi:aromatic acid exporter family protein [Aerococcaceae bacterium zg-BR9]|uniref:aromatic acid exporter family protein n=1 Tax=Aerococcaceae bacterium zg-1292 TaxID=2774330 RepID=UPI004064BFBC|nr:aromatic acid exporter family protein [Aerococcaceae bacterium zg-BR9]